MTSEATPQQAPLPLVLPHLTINNFRVNRDRLLDEAARAVYFSPRVIAWALQNGQSVKGIKTYLERFSDEQIHSSINNRIKCVKQDLSVPVLFFAVEHGSLDMIRILVKAGASVEQRSNPWEISVLAFAILRSDTDKIDTTEVFKLLLPLGADPTQIPRDLWFNYIKTPKSEITSTGIVNQPTHARDQH